MENHQRVTYGNATHYCHGCGDYCGTLGENRLCGCCYAAKAAAIRKLDENVKRKAAADQGSSAGRAD